jgi:hypothetical protein
MIENIKKHSVKILVFMINILLAAIAVLVIRGKDQSRLLQDAAKENVGSGNAQNNQSFPSFENSVSADGAESDPVSSDVSVQPSPSDNGAITPSMPVPTPAIVPAPKLVPAPAPANPSLVPIQNSVPVNTKTKTS